VEFTSFYLKMAEIRKHNKMSLFKLFNKPEKENQLPYQVGRNGITIPEAEKKTPP